MVCAKIVKVITKYNKNIIYEHKQNIRAVMFTAPSYFGYASSTISFHSVPVYFPSSILSVL